MTKNRTPDQEADRLDLLLELAHRHLLEGDGELTILMLQEALKSAERLPKKEPKP